MRLKIDIEKSIERKRLIPTSWYYRILDYFNCCFFAIVFIICIIRPTIGIAVTIDSTKIILISLVLIILFIAIYTLYKMDRLAIIDDNSKLDRNFFNLLAKENNWYLIKESDNILLYNVTPRYSHNRQLTIITKDKFIYINVMSFGMHSIKSPIYIRKDREILNQIIEKIKNNAT